MPARDAQREAKDVNSSKRALTLSTNSIFVYPLWTGRYELGMKLLCLVLLITFIPGVFASPPSPSAGLCAEQLIALARTKPLVLDSYYGLLGITDYDPQTDVLEVWPADAHRKFYFFNEDERVKSRRPFKLFNASARIVAELGTDESLAIIRDRVNRYIGIKRAGLFFASIVLNIPIRA